MSALMKVLKEEAQRCNYVSISESGKYVHPNLEHSSAVSFKLTEVLVAGLRYF